MFRVVDIRIEGDAGYACKGPCHGAEAFDHIAVREPHARFALGFARAADFHVMRLGDDADEGVDHDHRDEERRDAVVARRGIAGRCQAEFFNGHSLVQARKTADAVDDVRDEEKREHDDEDALDKVRDDRRGQAAQEAVGEKEDGHDADGEFGRNRAAGHRARGFARAQEHDADLDGKIEQAVQRVEIAEGFAESIFKKVGDGEVAQPAPDRRDEPVKRRGEQIEPLVPDSGHAQFVGRARNRDRLIRVRARAKGVHDHKCLAKTAPAHEVVARVLDLPRDPKPSDHNADQINRERCQIQRV